MCQIRFDSAVWPGARQPSGRSTSEAYGPVSFGITLFRLSAPPLIAIGVPKPQKADFRESAWVTSPLLDLS